MKLPQSLSFRLALTYTALFAVSVLVLAGVTWWTTVQAPFDKVEAQVTREAARLGDVYILDGRVALSRRLQMRDQAHEEPRPFHAFFDRDGHLITGNLPSWPKVSANSWVRLEASIHADRDDDDYQALAIDRTFKDGARLIVGRDIEKIDDQEEELRAALVWLIAATLLLGITGGWLMSRAIGRRVEAISEAAQGVIDGDLSGRIATSGSGDDFDKLGVLLNRMLDRIETLVDAVRRVSDSVAHELRTPLARLRATLEDLGAAPANERAELLVEANTEAVRIEAIFDAVLRIARIEAGRHSAVHTPMNLSRLLADAVELYDPEAEARALDLSGVISADLVVSGDRDLIFQAVCNLLDNAIKFAPVGGKVAVAAYRDAARVVVEVRDNGPGIDPEHVDHVVERFYRAPATAVTKGEGLGLSLVAVVAEAHHSEMRLLDAGPGLLVRWSFPTEGN